MGEEIESLMSGCALKVISLGINFGFCGKEIHFEFVAIQLSKSMLCHFTFNYSTVIVKDFYLVRISTK